MMKQKTILLGGTSFLISEKSHSRTPQKFHSMKILNQIFIEVYLPTKRVLCGHEFTNVQIFQ